MKQKLYLSILIFMSICTCRVKAYPFVSTREVMEFRSSSLGGDMKALGVDIFVGPSCLGFGKGLFLACTDRNMKSIKIPAGTKICRYAKGVFDMRIMGDKVVDYGMYNLAKRVLYKNEILTLKEALMNNDNSLLGHFVQVDGSTGLPTEVRPVTHSFFHSFILSFFLSFFHSFILYSSLIYMTKFNPIRIQHIQR